MFKKTLVVLMALAMLVALNLPAFAQAYVEGKVDALDKDAKKITIDDAEYTLSDEEAAKTQARVGDEVEATIEGTTVKSLIILPKAKK